jgi:hypothetical protein
VATQPPASPAACDKFDRRVDGYTKLILEAEAPSTQL